MCNFSGDSENNPTLDDNHENPEEDVEEDTPEFTFDDYLKQQSEKRKGLMEITGGVSKVSVTKSSEKEFKGMQKKEKASISAEGGDKETSMWTSLEAKPKSQKAKTKKEKNLVVADFKIKDDYARPPRGEGRGRGRGGRGGRGGRDGGRGRGGLRAKLDDQTDFPSLG